MKHLLLLSFLGLLSHPLLGQTETVETNVVIQLKMHIQHPQEESGSALQQKSSTYTFKTLDLIHRLTRNTGVTFSPRARLIHRYNTRSEGYYVVEKRVAIDVTALMLAEFNQHLTSDTHPYTINKKIVNKTQLGSVKHFGMGALTLATQDGETDLVIRGPYSKILRQVPSKESPQNFFYLITQNLTGLGGFDFTGDGPEFIGLAEGTFKTVGHKTQPRSKVPPINIGAGLGGFPGVGAPPASGWPWYGDGSSGDLHLLPAQP